MTDENLPQTFLIETQRDRDAKALEERLAAHEKKVVDHLNLTLGAFQTSAMRAHDMHMKQAQDMIADMKAIRDSSLYAEKVRATVDGLYKELSELRKNIGIMHEEISKSALDFIADVMKQHYGSKENPLKKFNEESKASKEILYDMDLEKVLTNGQTVTLLYNNGICTVGDLIKYSGKTTKLKKKVKIGTKSMRTIRLDLNAIGLDLKYECPSSESHYQNEMKNRQTHTA